MNATKNDLNVMFQSLFFWMMVIGSRLNGRRKHKKQVSILVLLDDGHRGSA